jgi:hypothetical protein
MTGMDIEVRLHYVSSRPLEYATVEVAFNLANAMGLVITNFNSRDAGQSRMPIHHHGMFTCRWPRVGLKAGTYVGALFCSINGEIADWLQNAIEINIEAGDYFGSGRVIGAAQGDVVFMHDWRSQPQSTNAVTPIPATG